MNEEDCKAFYDRVGQSNGWDFSKLKVLTEGAQADIYEEVRQACKPSDLLLDIGTGGGEAVLAIRDAVLLLVGIDRSPGMIRTAQANLAKSGAKHTPIIPGFGLEPGDFEIVRAFMEKNRTEKGIRTNAKRYIIQARR